MTEPGALQRLLELTNPGPVLVDLPGPFDLQSYGVMMAAAFGVGGWLCQRELGRRGLPPQLAWTLVVHAAIGGLVGSRVLALLGHWSAFTQDPVRWLLTGGGYTFYGGLLGAVAAIAWAIRRRGLPWRPVVDSGAPSAALGQALGRVGCQLSGDGDWGQPTTLPWGMTYPDALGGWPEPPGVRVHPTPLYEALAYGAVFAFLWWMRRRDLAPGSLLWLYLVLAPLARLLVELVRTNPPVLGPLTQAQAISLALMAVGAIQLLRARRRAPAAA